MSDPNQPVSALSPGDAVPQAAGAAPPPPLGAPPLTPPPPRSIPAEFFSDAVKKHTHGAPGPLRMMAARAMAPLAPKDLVHTVYLLGADADPKVAEAAQKTFAGFPDRILMAVLGDRLAPEVLNLLAVNLANNATAMTKVLLNPHTPDTTFVLVGERSLDEGVITLVANNQERLLRHPEICSALKRNPHTLKSTLENVVDFLVRNGIVLDDVPEFVESVSRLGKHELEAAVANIEVPFQLLRPDLQEKAWREGKAPASYKPGVPLEVAPDVDEDISAEELEKLAEAGDNKDPEDEEFKTTQQLIDAMTTGKKIAAAIKGNKSTRDILIRDPNRMIAEAAIKNPQITPGEVTRAANSRSINESVLRYIAQNKELQRPYSVKLAIASNPKAPVSAALRFLSVLRDNDVRTISKSRTVSAAVRQQAVRVVKAKIK